MLSLFLIWSYIEGYDTFDSAVVVSDCEDNARRIHPNGQDILKYHNELNEKDKIRNHRAIV